MIDVKCLASGSSGNSYAIDDGESVLLLEAGIPAKKIMTGYLDIIPRIAGCLITHEHGDHAKGAAGIAAKGIDLYATAGTFEGIPDIDRPYRKHVIRAGETFKIEKWTITPLEAQHDANEPVCYLIQSVVAHENLFFITDSFYLRYKFVDRTGKRIPLNVIMVECNYSLPLLNKSIAAGRVPESLKPRLLQSHFSLENVKDFLKANDMNTVRHIYLIHLSGNNSDPEQFKREIQRVAGKPVTVF